MAVGNLNSGAGIPPTIIDAKGDLLVGTADNVVNRLGVTGTTGAVLTADAGETTGLKWAAAGSVGGLVHINTTSFSAVASQSLDNVFTSTYENYRLAFNITSTSTTMTLGLKMRAGSDNSTNYYFSGIGGNLAGNAATIFNGSSNTTSATIGRSVATGIRSIVLDFISPALARTTIFHGFYLDHGNLVHYTIGGAHEVSTAFDGFSVIASTGNITGSLSLYGYAKA